MMFGRHATTFEELSAFLKKAPRGCGQAIQSCFVFIHFTTYFRGFLGDPMKVELCRVLV